MERNSISFSEQKFSLKFPFVNVYIFTIGSKAANRQISRDTEGGLTRKITPKYTNALDSQHTLELIPNSYDVDSMNANK